MRKKNKILLLMKMEERKKELKKRNGRVFQCILKLVLAKFIIQVFFLFTFKSFADIKKFLSKHNKASELEVKIAKFAYGLQLLGDYRKYDLAIFLLRDGLYTPFEQWAKYYIGKSYLFLEEYKEAKNYFLSITRSFPWYEIVLHNLTYISYKMGDTTLCDKMADLGYPRNGAPELYEVIAECLEKKIYELRTKGKEKDLDKIKDRIRDVIFLLIENSLNPPDLLDYSSKIKKAEEISQRVFSREPRNILSEDQRERIASLLLEMGRAKESLRWTTDDFKKARAYFIMRMYDKAIELAKPLFNKEKDRDKKEKLLIILMLSYARKSEPDIKEFERYAEIYFKLYPSERFAGNLAIKLGVEKLLDGDKSEAERLFLFASRSPHKDIEKRTKFLMKYSLGHNVDVKTEGFLKLLEEYKKGFARIDIGVREGENPLWVELSSRILHPPSELSEALYYLKIYLGGSRMSGLPQRIIKNVSLSNEEKTFLMKRGFFTEFFPEWVTSLRASKGQNQDGLGERDIDFRSVLPVYVPPPMAFEKEIIKAGIKYGVPPALIFAIALSESHFNPIAVSSSRAIGLTQVIPPTAREVFLEFNLPFTEEFLFEPEINAKVGAYYLAKLKKNFGSWSLAVAGYNAGPTAVKSWLQKWGDLYCKNPEIFFENIPYRETRLYTMRVLSYYYEYAKMLKEEVNLEEIFRCSGEVSEKNQNQKEKVD